LSLYYLHPLRSGQQPQGGCRPFLLSSVSHCGGGQCRPRARIAEQILLAIFLAFEDADWHRRGACDVAENQRKKTGDFCETSLTRAARDLSF
jgi:hypothetical protein